MAIDAEVKERYDFYQSMDEKKTHKLYNIINDVQIEIYVAMHQKIQEYKDNHPTGSAVYSLIFSLVSGGSGVYTYDLTKEGLSGMAINTGVICGLTLAAAVYTGAHALRQSKTRGRLEVEILNDKDEYLGLPTERREPMQDATDSVYQGQGISDS